jgi:replicative DNA helicase
MMAVSGNAEVIIGKQRRGPVGTVAASAIAPATTG